MKEIQLTQGKVALVSDCDFEWLNQWKWCAKKCPNGRFYAIRGVWENERVKGYFMHRVILGQTNPKIFVDHHNMQGLDNQRENLRECDNRQNTRNRPANKGSRSKFKGVSRHTKNPMWVAQITASYKNKHLGTFKTEEDAARAYDKAAKELHGEFCHLNFPNE